MTDRQTSLRVTPGQRHFLRGIAPPNPHARRGEEAWWAAQDLIRVWYEDFGNRTAMSLTGTAKSCVIKGLAASRQIGTRGHGWMEYRITSLGRGYVSDSCIGGGLPWAYAADGARCPACQVPARALGDIAGLIAEAPAHPLPGHEAPAIRRKAS